MSRPLLIFMTCLFVSFAANAETRFFSSLEDVPLAPGIAEIPDQTVAFDKPEGRIVESVASMDNAARDSIEKFYDDSLPQLGWRKEGALYFRRENESLRLSFETASGHEFLRVSVAPGDK